jgi:hypothetical protein
MDDFDSLDFTCLLDEGQTDLSLGSIDTGQPNQHVGKNLGKRPNSDVGKAQYKEQYHYEPEDDLHGENTGKSDL